MTEETQVTNENEQIKSESPDNDFYAKLAAIRDGNGEIEEGQEPVPEQEQEQENVAEVEAQSKEQEIQEQPNFDDDIDDLDPKKLVPYKRLKQVIDKKSAIAKSLQEEREERLRYQIQLENYQKAMDIYFKGGKEADEKPDEQQVISEVEPIDESAHNFYMQKIQDLENKLNEVQGKVVTKEEMNTEKASQAFANAISSQVDKYKQIAPDYHDALKHLQQIKINEKKMLYTDETQATNAALQEIIYSAAAIYQHGKNVPEAMYTLAKQYGYLPKTKAQPDVEAVQRNMQRGASDSGSRASVPVGSGNYTSPGYLKKIKGADGQVDSNKFQAILDQVRRGG